MRASALMHDCSEAVVPNPIDQRLARQLLALPQDCPLLLFGAMGGDNDPRTGTVLLLTAFAHLRTALSLQNLQLVVFGQRGPRSALQLGFPVHFTGHLHDDLSLRALYSAADAMVVHSRQEAFGQTAPKPTLAAHRWWSSAPVAAIRWVPVPLCNRNAEATPSLRR